MRIFIFTFVLLLLRMTPVQAGDGGFQIIVNPHNPIDTIEKKELAEFFLKKKIYWPDQATVLAVDLDPASEVRRRFSEKILDRPVSAVRNYWQQLLFSGRGVPPPEFKTEQEVLSFVSSHPDAIGYVSVSADVGSLKTVKIR